MPNNNTNRKSMARMTMYHTMQWLQSHKEAIENAPEYPNMQAVVAKLREVFPDWAEQYSPNNVRGLLIDLGIRTQRRSVGGRTRGAGDGRTHGYMAVATATLYKHIHQLTVKLGEPMTRDFLEQLALAEKTLDNRDQRHGLESRAHPILRVSGNDELPFPSSTRRHVPSARGSHH